MASVAWVARELNKIAGVHAFGLDVARRRLAQGFRFMTLMADTRLIRAAVARMLATLRNEAIGARPP